MKNANNPSEQTFTELMANNKLTKENMHEAIELVAGKYLGFRSSSYEFGSQSTGGESIAVYAHYHGGKCYCGQAFISSDTPAIEAISSALVMLNNAILSGFEAQPAPLECAEIQDHAGHNITDAFLSENETADLRTEYAA